MYGKISGILMPVLALGLIGTGVWGYQENQDKNSILIKAENQYQNSFHNLNFHMDQLQDELGKTLAMNSKTQLTPSLTNVWRLAYSAHHDVGQLPLTLLPFNKTEEFLSNVADFSYQTAVRDLDKKPLTPQEHKTLQTLYTHSKDIQSNLMKLQSTVIKKNLRWMDVETALASEEKPRDNTIIDGLKTVDKNVSGYRDIDFGSGGIASLNHTRTDKMKNLKGPAVSEQEARDRAVRFSAIPSSQIESVTVTPNQKGTEYEAYSVRIKKKGKSEPITLDVAKRGGQVIWLLDERPTGRQQIKIEDARRRAETFLSTHGYKSMDPISYADYTGVAAFTFVYRQGDVRVYPDSVTVKVALDNGEITGFQSEPYLLNHKPRIIPAHQLSLAQAHKRVSPAFHVKETRRAIIENERGQEVLCYEFYGSLNNEHYRIYVNARTGEEVKVDKIKAVSI
ncbi:germination protein YpeB [Aneurinibacillus sp. Ricciae_BoGa-3]|uniref:germination protein YpeB n=1 Tax=Aneurinibacillus sp. Ricciae_BoGa-3 TaxID=3022697 RepID=UPI002340026E|nr:germination protein YpeB [Aneurinibacillus sp. Ricciae_BoGa-3]WCK56059.1 germination protein YpeB [Aneurinibacillus sp. Ricciae_BoGa-3]